MKAGSHLKSIVKRRKDLDNCDNPFVAEIHVHSTVSDGALSPEQLLKLARRRQIHVLSITDHDSFRGSSLAQRIARLYDKSPLIIPGAEIRTEDHGDMLVYCVDYHENYPTTLEELYDWSRENNCIIIAAHPYHIGRHSIGRAIVDYLDYIDGIEVWNSRGIPLLNYPAIKLAEKTEKPATSGSDAHVSREFGVSPILLCEEVSSPEDFIDLILKKRILPYFGLPGPIALAEIVAWAIMKRLK